MIGKGFEPLLREAAIKAIDAVGEKLAGAEVAADNAVTRLLHRWNALSRGEKENVAGIVIATATTAVAALATLKGAKKKGIKKAIKKAVKKTGK